MKLKTVLGSTMGVALLGLGILTGSVIGTSQASAQTPPAAATATTAQTAPAAPSKGSQPAIQAAITQQQAEQAALAANPGATVDHTQLGQDASGTATYDVDFTNGGGAIVNAQTGAVITSEAAGTDQGGGPRGGGGGADQAALAAKATVSQADAEKAALAANAGATVDHSRLGQDAAGVVFWDVDFSNGGGATVNATTGAIIANEAAGTDQGGGPHGGQHGGPPTNNSSQAPTQ